MPVMLTFSVLLISMSGGLAQSGFDDPSVAMFDAARSDDECSRAASGDEDLSSLLQLRGTAHDVSDLELHQPFIDETVENETVALHKPDGNDTVENETVEGYSRRVLKNSSDACPIYGYNGPRSGTVSCFCHKAANPVCKYKSCTCPEGCHPNPWKVGRTGATFENIKGKVTGCAKAYLTIPTSYIYNVADLLKSCGGYHRARKELIKLMAQGTNEYRKIYPTGDIMQCIHKPKFVSVHWLHVHVFCAGGGVDGLPNKAYGYCTHVNHQNDADAAAEKVLTWAQHEDLTGWAQPENLTDSQIVPL